MNFFNRTISHFHEQRHVVYVVGGLTLAVSFLLFYRLGELALDPDEALIIEWTKPVFQDNPSVWDLPVSFVKNGGFVRLHEKDNFGALYPGINMYLSALSFHAFGINAWAARLPSAIIALFTIPLFYLLANRLICRSNVALIATVLFATSAPLLFLMRQNRYTATTILLTLWMLLAYHGILKQKKYALPQFVLSLVLFFYTSYYILCPVAFGLTCHALLFNPARVRRIIILLFASLFIVVSLSGPLMSFDYTWLIDILPIIAADRMPIMILTHIYTSGFEFNVIGMPFIALVIYLLTNPSRSLPEWLPWAAAGLWGGFMIMASSLGPMICTAFGSGLDYVWPSFSPWLFNRLVDPRSWSVLCLCIGAVLTVRTLWRVESETAKMMAIPVVVIMGAIVAYSLLYPKIWTRYIACLIALSFIPGGYLLHQIFNRYKLPGIALGILVVTSNILSVVPFTPDHYPYWAWKLPHWTYRLLSGDAIADIVLNFYTDHHYW